MQSSLTSKETMTYFLDTETSCSAKNHHHLHPFTQNCNPSLKIPLNTKQNEVIVNRTIFYTFSMILRCHFTWLTIWGSFYLWTASSILSFLYQSEYTNSLSGNSIAELQQLYIYDNKPKSILTLFGTQNIKSWRKKIKIPFGIDFLTWFLFWQVNPHDEGILWWNQLRGCLPHESFVLRNWLVLCWSFTHPAGQCLKRIGKYEGMGPMMNLWYSLNLVDQPNRIEWIFIFHFHSLNFLWCQE